MKSVAITINGLLNTARLAEDYLDIPQLGVLEPATVQDALAIAAWFTQWAVNNPD